MKRTRIFKIGLKNKFGPLNISNFKTYYTATLIKIVQCGIRIDILINGVDFTF